MKSHRVEDVAEVRLLVRGTGDETLDEAMATRFVETRSLLRGHFLLQSGLHSDVFLRAAQLLYRPADGRLFAEPLARQVDAAAVDVVVATEAAASFLAEPLAEALHKPHLLVRIDERRRPTNAFTKGDLDRDARVLVVGDVVTTGGTLGTIEGLVKSRGARVIQTAVLAALSRNWLTSPTRVALLRPMWEPTSATACPACQREEALWPAYELA